jgi:hypothetical protein
VAARLQDELGIEVDMERGGYGEFIVQVGPDRVVSAGALGFLGVLPSPERVLERVRARLNA